MAVPGKKAAKQFSSSTTSMGSDEDLKVYCQPCDRDGPRLPAHGYCTNCSEHLCETCFTLHRRHTLSRHHTLQDKSSMPQTLSPVTPRQPDNFTKACPKHNMEMIKFYCHDHEALFCSVCVTLDHTAASCKVNYIPDISGHILNSTEYQDILKKIDAVTEKSYKTLQDMKKMYDKSYKSLTDVLTKLMTFRSKINQRLDELEQQVMKAAKVIQKDNNKNLMKVETVCGDVPKSLKSSSDAIKHLNTSKNGNDLFIELKHTEQIMKDYEESVTMLTEYKVKEYNFELNEVISNLLDKEKSMGTLEGRTLCPDLKSRQCSYIDQINIKTSQDKGLECKILGMTLLSPDLLIITDWNNRAVKMVDISRKSVLDQQCLDSEPRDVTSVSQNELAVTLPDNQTIQFFSVGSNKLKKKHTLKVDGNCYGISCCKDRMVVSFRSPAKVQILLINGTVLQTIQDVNIFKHPFYITTNRNCIYVSDSRMKSIIKLNWQCEVTGKFVCTNKPYGLTMSDDGTMFVCYSNHTIGEISGDCTKGQVVVKAVPYAPTVVWSAETCTLFTSSLNKTAENSFIKIFKLS